MFHNDQIREKITGVIIAGGRSRRFGRPKAFAKREGRFFFEWSIDALTPYVDDMVLITNKELEQQFREKTVTPIATDDEAYAGKGPLAGIYTAMTEKEADWYAVLPVDVPFMKEEVIGQLLKSAVGGKQAVVPLANGRLQPLIGLYHRNLKPIIQQLLEVDELKMKALLERADVHYISFTDESPFVNINRQEDFDTYI